MNREEMYLIALKALTHEVVEKHDDAFNFVSQLADTDDGLALAMIVWIDAYIDHCLDGKLEYKCAPGASYLSTASGEITGADAVPFPIRFAGELVVARAERSQELWEAAMNKLPNGPDPLTGECVLAVLNVCANSIRRLPRGALLPTDRRPPSPN